MGISSRLKVICLIVLVEFVFGGKVILGDVEESGDEAVNGAIYEWIGAAGDGSWNNPKNWKVTGSEKGWKYPNEEFKNNYTNQDCVAINIKNGDTVKAYSLSIDGKRDGSTTNVLTIANKSTLILGNALYIADYEKTNGAVNVIGGSTLEVKKLIDIGNWSGRNSKAKLNISDSILKVGNFKGYSIRIAVGTTSEMTVSGNSKVTTTGDMRIADGGHNGKLIVNGGEIIIGGRIIFGGGTSESKAYVYMNGGKLKAENLVFKLKDAKVVFAGGELLVNSKNVSKEKMKELIDSGRIDVSGAPNGYKIINVDGYTTLAGK